MKNPSMYKVGDYVLIKSETERAKPIIGKIEEIVQEENLDKTFRYNKYLYPEDTSLGRQVHNSINEIYKTQDKEKEFYSNIISHCEVQSFENYIKKSNSKYTKNTYFYRQVYSQEEDAFIPDIDPSCACKKIFNPDIEYSICSKCKKPYHNECLTKQIEKFCPNGCGNQIEIAAKQNEKKIEKSLIGNKRERTDEQQRSQIEEKYRNLPEKSRIYLNNLIESIEKINNMLSKTMSETQKARQNTRDKILNALLYGVEELKMKKDDFWDKVDSTPSQNNKNKLNNNPIKLSKNNINEGDFIKNYCDTLSIEIEDFIFLKNKEQISSSYKKRLFTLYTNLLDERNSELRQSILLNEILPNKLVIMTSEELAPSSVKKRRIEQQNKYFKEQVLVEGDVKIIAKSHKDALLSVEPKDKNSEGFNPFEMFENKKDIGQKKEQEENREIRMESQEEKEKREKKVTIIKKQSEHGHLSEKKKKEDSKEAMKELKFKNLPSDKLKFYYDLNEYKKETLGLKLNEELKTRLNPDTVNEMNRLRKEFSRDKLIK